MGAVTAGRHSALLRLVGDRHAPGLASRRPRPLPRPADGRRGPDVGRRPHARRPVRDRPARPQGRGEPRPLPRARRRRRAVRDPAPAGRADVLRLRDTATASGSTSTPTTRSPTRTPSTGGARATKAKETVLARAGAVGDRRPPGRRPPAAPEVDGRPVERVLRVGPGDEEARRRSSARASRSSTRSATAANARAGTSSSRPSSASSAGSTRSPAASSTPVTRGDEVGRLRLRRRRRRHARPLHRERGRLHAPRRLSTRRPWRRSRCRSFRRAPTTSTPAATTPNGRFTTFGVETAKAPRTSYVYDWEKGTLTRWVVPSAPEVDTPTFAAATLETYPARDGTPIPVFVRRPARCEPEPCPVIVEFHGGPEGQAQPGFSTYAQIFVDAGFVFVEPNVRGSDGYGKTWLDADNGREAPRDPHRHRGRGARGRGRPSPRTARRRRSASWAAATAATRRSSR